MEFKIIYSVFYGMLFASIASFTKLFSKRVSQAFYEKSRKTIKKKWHFVLSGRSICDSCGKQLPLIYAFPLFGYFFTRGKCPNCKHRVSKSYVIEEWISFFYGFIAVFYTNKSHLFFLFLLAYFFLCYFISYIDIQHFLIPTESWIFFLIVALIEYFFVKGESANLILDFSVPVSWSLLFLFLVYLQPGKLGFSDIYLAGVFSFAAGFPNSLFLPTVASFIAIIYFFIKYRKIPWEVARKNKIPFGLFLSLAFLLLKLISIPGFIY